MHMGIAGRRLGGEEGRQVQIGSACAGTVLFQFFEERDDVIEEGSAKALMSYEMRWRSD